MLLKIKCICDGDYVGIDLGEVLEGLSGMFKHPCPENMLTDDQTEIVLETDLTISEFVVQYMVKMTEFYIMEDLKAEIGEPGSECYGLAEMILEYPLSVAPDDARRFLELRSQNLGGFWSITEV